MNLFKRKKGHKCIERIKMPHDFLIDFDGTVVELSLSPHPKALYIDSEHKMADVYSIENIKNAIELVEDALLLENNGILSGAFITDPNVYTHHLQVDYHNLTMLGDNFDKRVTALKKRLGKKGSKK